MFSGVSGFQSDAKNVIIMIFQTFALFQILTIYHVHDSQSLTQVQSNKNYPGEVLYSDVGSITDSKGLNLQA